MLTYSDGKECLIIVNGKRGMKISVGKLTAGFQQKTRSGALKDKTALAPQEHFHRRDVWDFSVGKSHFPQNVILNHHGKFETDWMRNREVTTTYFVSVKHVTSHHCPGYII